MDLTYSYFHQTLIIMRFDIFRIMFTCLSRKSAKYRTKLKERGSQIILKASSIDNKQQRLGDKHKEVLIVEDQQKKNEYDDQKRKKSYRRLRRARKTKNHSFSIQQNNQAQQGNEEHDKIVLMKFFSQKSSQGNEKILKFQQQKQNIPQKQYSNRSSLNYNSNRSSLNYNSNRQSLNYNSNQIINKPKILQKQKNQISTIVQYNNIVSQQVKYYLDQIIEQFLPQHRPKIVPLNFQSMKHSEQQMGVNQGDLQILQLEIRYGNIMNAFVKALIEEQHDLAIKLFQNMNKQQKNKVDDKGISVLKIVTLKAIKKNSKQIMDLLKKVIHDSALIDNFLNSKIDYSPYYPPIQETIMFRNIPTLTHLFQMSYHTKIYQLRSKLMIFINFLSQIDDFFLQIDAKVCSFFPLIEKIAPNDTIKIYKRGKFIRVDYSLIGYQGFQTKRRHMSCIIGNFSLNNQNDEPSILTVNHKHQSYTNLLDPLSQQELAAIIEDLLSTQLKRGVPQIQQTRFKSSHNIFNDKVFENISGFLSQKFWLKIKYRSQTEKFMPGCKNKQVQLQFLNSFQSYKNYKPKPTQQIASKIKQVNLQIWIPKKFPIQFEHFLKIMQYFSLASETGKLISNFLNELSRKNLITQFPTRIHIPINFTLYIDLSTKNVQTSYSQDIQFDFTKKYGRIARQQYQKTLYRIEKRLLLAKFYL